LPYTEVINIKDEEVMSISPEEIIEEVITEIELNITNESDKYIKPNVKDDNETEGQITLEL